jgi:two-component system chemotaxis response regulator CheY
MRRMLKSILSKMEHEIVDEASNGIEAVEKYRQHKPDLTTMDITMPERDGIEAVRIICGKDKKAKIVMVTAIGHNRYCTRRLPQGRSTLSSNLSRPSR